MQLITIVAFEVWEPPSRFLNSSCQQSCCGGLNRRSVACRRGWDCWALETCAVFSRECNSLKFSPVGRHPTQNIHVKNKQVGVLKKYISPRRLGDLKKNALWLIYGLATARNTRAVPHHRGGYSCWTSSRACWRAVAKVG
jgi:hypothetical protein